MTSNNPSPYPTSAPPPSQYGTSTEYTDPVTTPGSGAEGSSDDLSMKDKAADSAQAGKQAAGEVAQTAAGKAQDVAAEAKSQVRHLAGQAQDQLREQAGAQHRNLVSNLRALADQLNSMAQNSDKSGPATDLVGEAGTRAQSVASWLDDREPGQLVEELRSFARRKPAVFIVGALAAGVVAGRLTRGVIAVHQDDSGDGDGGSVGDEIAASRHRARSTPDRGTGPAAEAGRPAAPIGDGRGPLDEVTP